MNKLSMQIKLDELATSPLVGYFGSDPGDHWRPKKDVADGTVSHWVGLVTKN